MAQTLALKFKITETSWKRKKMKFSRDNSIKGLQYRRRKNIKTETVLKQSRMQCLIREVHVKCQESSVEKTYLTLIRVKATANVVLLEEPTFQFYFVEP